MTSPSQTTARLKELIAYLQAHISDLKNEIHDKCAEIEELKDQILEAECELDELEEEEEGQEFEDGEAA